MTIITTGVQGGGIVARQEIRTMMKDQDLFTLYLLALERMQKVDESDPLSWFQICGIHGRPYTPYDEPANAPTGSLGAFGGYCTHSSILFPPWHRPYLALFEQILAKHVTDIANEYSTPALRERYVTAAQRFRIPYWDWAYYADPPDVITKQARITGLNTPQGPRDLDNPLYQYRFHNKVGHAEFGDGFDLERIWEGWPGTLRWPTNTRPTATSQANAVDATMNNNRLTIRDRTYNLLVQSTTFQNFSNDGFQGPETDPRYYDSLESIHGQIHGFVGGGTRIRMGGHMSIPDFAAFDPIFWLHHCNVDRIFALWQALRPDEYVTPMANPDGTWTTRPGTIENVDSPLTPFRISENRYWTSADARDTRSLFYTYPELAKWADLDPVTKAARLRTDINAMYGSTAPWGDLDAGLFSVSPSVPIANKTAPTTFEASPVAPAAAISMSMAANEPRPSAAKIAAMAFEKHAASVPPPGGHPAPQHHVHVPSHKHHPTSTHHGHGHGHGHGKKYTEWIANITVEKHAAKTTFYVYIFLGDFNPDSTKWAQEPNLVGTHVIFANNILSTGCERCHTAAREGKLVTGTIPLTGALGDRLGKEKLASLEPEEIVPYLQKELHWRIQTSEKEIERAELPSLKVSVAHAPVTLPASISELPVWGEAVKDFAVTAGRPGGAGEDD
ncbi:hypothetical protein M408DRAFT_173274 [Serendipita vermifera MAFF 305830]|uniref:tyrosinase n=1 Tax=Serendipita vermifera MAFF 305830 TaxID=933852 RepID=A0A0C3B6I5_SERVB|nr:hypothetical protein M408DRAFT_173274 [Serendipita vermifera MAFF 305830]